MEKRQIKALTSLLTKIAGLVFIAFLAISVGVIFGTLFNDWVREEPMTPVQSWHEEMQSPLTFEFPETDQVYGDVFLGPDTAVDMTVKYKVQLGPFPEREEALNIAAKLEAQGYPVFVSPGVPCYVQVGAFANPVNADQLQRELGEKGFSAFIKEE